MQRAILILLLSAVSCASIVVELVPEPFAYKIETVLFRDNLPTLNEMDHYKKLLPHLKDWFNGAMWASRLGQENYYRQTMYIRLGSLSHFLSAEVITPNGAVLPFTSVDGNFVLWKNSFFFDDIRADFPPGEYTVKLTGILSLVITKTFTLPEYDRDFLTMEGSPFWQNNVLNLKFPSIDAANESYYFCVNNLIDGGEVWADWVEIPHPYEATLDFNSLIRKEDGNFEIYAEASSSHDNNGVKISRTSGKHWLITQKPLPVYEDKITKCSVTARAEKIGSIAFSGRLKAVEADFLNTENVCIEIAADTMLEPLDFKFPVDAATFKSGKFNSSLKGFDGSTVSCRYDAGTHAFAFSAKGLDLAGLACPFTVSITVGDYCTAQIELDEDIVNGPKKACAPQLIMGMVNTLAVDTLRFKTGKQVGMDRFSAKGMFTLGGMPAEGGSLVISLGSQTFTVDSAAFTEKKERVWACSNVAAAEGNGIVSATLDADKCTYTLSIRNAAIEADGLTPFGLSVLGYSLNAGMLIDMKAL